MPAKAGIQKHPLKNYKIRMDSRFRGNDKLDQESRIEDPASRIDLVVDGFFNTNRLLMHF
jgi:hypothetical protein